MNAKPDVTGQEPRREPRGRPKAADEGSAVKPELSTQKLGRYREIAAVLTRNGLWALLADSWQQSLPLSPQPGPQREGEPLALPAEVRAVFEELGPTFIKFGQFLSTRPDLLPPHYIAELSKLKDSPSPVPYALVVAVIESELRARLEELFASFDKAPLETASIGQVHAAQLLSGEEVVLKVQRPLVATEIESDLPVLLELAREAEDHTTLGRGHDLKGLLDEFASALRCELDYVREGQNIERLGDDLAKVAGIRLPRIHWNYTTRRVIVLERIRGSKRPAWQRWVRRAALGRNPRPADGRARRGSLSDAPPAPMWLPFGLLRPGQL